MRLFLAIRVFFEILFSTTKAGLVRDALVGKLPAAPVAEVPKPAPKAPPAPKPPARSEAVTLLATLQREGRLIDFLKEDLAAYSDAQIGAVARQIHRDCGAIVARLFDIRPVLDQPEGAPVDLAAGFDAGRFRLTGNVSGEPPFHGRLMHHGWEAAKCELPAWTGKETSARVIAPAEVEL
jgi:hypothetical protein